MTLFQDNNKLKARFVWWVVGWRLNGFSLRVVSGILPAMFSDSARSGGGDIEISGSGKSTPKSQFKRASGQNHTNKKGLFNNSRTAIAGAIIGLLLVFYNSKNLNCIGALSFFKICSHVFMILKSNWSSDFGHAETANGAKNRVLLRHEFFCSSFKVEWENGVWTKIRFLGSGFFFTCGNFTHSAF